MRLLRVKMDLVTYGLGDTYNPDYMPKNSQDSIQGVTWCGKPYGPLWASPYGSSYGWKEWNRSSGYSSCKVKFHTRFIGNLAIVANEDDTCDIPRDEEYDRRYGITQIDFGKIILMGADAFLCGAACTTFDMFHCWDCESVVVFNKRCLRAISEEKAQLVRLAGTDIELRKHLFPLRKRSH